MNKWGTSSLYISSLVAICRHDLNIKSSYNATLGVANGLASHRPYRGYPAKRALSAMRKHGGKGPFGRIPSIYAAAMVTCRSHEAYHTHSHTHTMPTVDMILMEVSQRAYDMIHYISGLYGYLYVYEIYVNLIWYLYLFMLNKICLSLSVNHTHIHFQKGRLLAGFFPTVEFVSSWRLRYMIPGRDGRNQPHWLVNECFINWSWRLLTHNLESSLTAGLLASLRCVIWGVWVAG